jgi:hypothetical protein
MPKKSSAPPAPSTQPIDLSSPVFIQRYTAIIPAKVSAVRVVPRSAPRDDGQAHVQLVVDGALMYLECKDLDAAMTLARAVFAAVFPGVPFE